MYVYNHTINVFSPEGVKDPMAVQIEDDQGLAEVMPFQGRAGVDHGQGRVGGQQVVVVCSWNYNVDEQTLQRFCSGEFFWFPYYQSWHVKE